MHGGHQDGDCLNFCQLRRRHSCVSGRAPSDVGIGQFDVAARAQRGRPTAPTSMANTTCTMPICCSARIRPSFLKNDSAPTPHNGPFKPGPTACSIYWKRHAFRSNASRSRRDLGPLPFCESASDTRSVFRLLPIGDPSEQFDRLYELSRLSEFD